MSMVGDTLEGFASIGAGGAARSAAVARKQELDNEAQLQTIAANESQAYMSVDLQRTLGNIKALTALRGLNPDSPSGMALESGSERLYGQNIQRTAFNARQQSASLIMAGRAAAMSGEAAATAGYLKGFGSFFKAATDPIAPGKGSIASNLGLV